MKPYSLESLLPLLQSLQKPGRYVGGEFGSYTKDDKSPLSIALCFPDLYEIAMSNQAIKIIYNLINSIDGVRCERVFAPAKDLEESLTLHDKKLFSLETLTPINQFDILAFSIGYELSMTNILSVLDNSGIPLLKQDRCEEHPIVIAGGPGASNPLPYSPFIDYVFLGESENSLKNWIPKAILLKKEGKGRRTIRTLLEDEPSFWFEKKNEITPIERKIDFSSDKSFSSGLPLPSISIVQNQGVVEIMRGCPNKCRFCHAGVFYRPKREKSWQNIFDEVDFLVNQCGYRTITLSSLSTGDFTNIDTLLTQLNEVYSSKGVSFNLPSLRVNSISLKLLNLVSVVRKSGLTFAVEAPTEKGQHGLNKDVSTARIIELLKEAKLQGWKQAKFYFMLGLPVSSDNEAQEIIDYLNYIQHNTAMQLNVNIGTFIPKVYTAFAEDEQLPEEESFNRVRFIKKNINNKRIRINYHSPFASYLEGLFARGDEQSGLIALEAYKRGARLDAWEEHLDRNLWKELLAEYPGIENQICKENTIQHRLNQMIDSGLISKHLTKEKERSSQGIITDPCEEGCKDHCGICDKFRKIQNSSELEINVSQTKTNSVEPYYVLFKYKKTDRAIFLGHLDIMRIMESALQRSNIKVAMSQGFNPKPRIEFASPLSLGISSDMDCFAVQLSEEFDILSEKLKDLNNKFPHGISVISYKKIELSGKIRMMKMYHASRWQFSHNDPNQLENLWNWILNCEYKDKFTREESLESSVLQFVTESESNKLQNPIKLLKAFTEQEYPLAHGWKVHRVEELTRDKTGLLVRYEDVL